MMDPAIDFAAMDTFLRTSEDTILKASRSQPGFGTTSTGFGGTMGGSASMSSLKTGSTERLFTADAATIFKGSVLTGADPKVKSQTIPMFRLSEGSESLLVAMKDRPPPRKTWDWHQAQENCATAGPGGFRMKLAPLPEDTKPRILKEKTATVSELSPFEAEETQQPKKMSRAQKYFNEMCKADRKHREADEKIVIEWEKADAQKAADRAKEAQEKDDESTAPSEASTPSSGSSGSSRASRKKAAAKGRAMNKKELEAKRLAEEAALEAEKPEYTPELVPYHGQMKVVLDIHVLRAPDADKSDSLDDDWGGSENASTATPAASSKSSESDQAERLDLKNELAELQEEMADFLNDEEEEEPDPDDVPEALRRRKKPRSKNIHDHDDPRKALALGGTPCFVPDAERLAICASLPPPPPPSLYGRHLIHLKPRLPLDISSNRYRDEQPSIMPDPPPFVPDLQNRRTWERKLLTCNFYQGAQNTLTEFDKQIIEQKSMNRKLTYVQRTGCRYDLQVDDALTHSLAWRVHLRRKRIEKMRRDREAAAQEAEAAEAAKEAAEKLAAEQGDEAGGAPKEMPAEGVGSGVPSGIAA
eukprot:gnl/TRDRNA2_/TRDRNA2_41920_c0_seq1.p1 gnl/TRDRNA2_/TRDRNA2_41920_c0~~gnl/TRDRNA2_/TRDRNA2_41920_c0_seq1.p1  ORF type:complete len:588 (-),score=148.40 gnl/TRDRNA2_/TRDRNA2_41920_c0_seq1:150-1913(-)